MKKLLFSTQFLFLVGCGHVAHHGTIAMKESDTLVHVSIHDVKIGDKVALFHNICERTDGPKGGGRMCKRQEIAPGTITKVFNEHYSLVEFPAGTKVSEGDFIETVSK
ncbi:MAG: hypothetical protein A4S09_06370 [Proteobacteria bacterium SG_bin7]|nr:MAG: hypothetical protein A4S09_06370 [Proteobacteria bacterium SG_bin7]